MIKIYEKGYYDMICGSRFLKGEHQIPLDIFVV